MLNPFTYTLLPDWRFPHVMDLTPDRLRELGLKALLLDLDGTLKRYDSPEVSAEMQDWIARTLSAGVRMCVVSNGRTARIGPMAERLGLPAIGGACKPLPFACRRALCTLGVTRHEVALVGDQIFTDVIAGNSAGIRTVLVHPLGGAEPLQIRLKRPIERWILGPQRRPENE